MLRFQWHDVRTPLFICIWMIVILIAKLLFHSNKGGWKAPDSALLIIAGFCVGTILDVFLPHEVYLDPDLFFLYLLPPIALEAGYFVPNRLFFQNLGTIITYAVAGTLFNIIAIGLTLYAFSPLYSVDISLIDLMLFSTLISAVDPVAVLSVFTEINVNELLYICVFGESLLNDAVTIVLYHSLSSMAMIGGDNLVLNDFVWASGSFFLVSIGGVLIGIIGAALTGYMTRLTKDLDHTQPLTCLLVPYVAYLVSESAHFSGILAIMVCGLLMKPYIRHNMSEDALITVKYFLKTIASHSEAMIFIFLGFSTFSRNHNWDFWFIGVTLVSCFVYRFLGTYLFSAIVNCRRQERIGLVDQFIMAYGGLRGAICYGLVMSVDKESLPAKDMFVSTTVVVIIFTVFLQGTTMKPLVQFLQVKRSETQRNKTITQILLQHIQEDTMAGIEAIVGIHGRHFWHQKLTKFDRELVRPFMTAKETSRGDDIVEKYTRAQVSEIKAHLLAVEPTTGVGSRDGLHLPMNPTPPLKKLSVAQTQTKDDGDSNV
uniref:Sodium/hydrogen exchanger n=1 Tax=Panagrellus redivivus TaxID=6233 RepID=A0A7E4VSN9_PANRE